MEGRILYFDEAKGKGVLIDGSGARYQFAKKAWKSLERPHTGRVVDFVDKGGVAQEIHALERRRRAVRVSRLADPAFIARLDSLLNCGLQNRYGFFAAIALALSCFLPFIHVPFAGNIGFIDSASGKLLFFMAAFEAMMFYGGVSRIYVHMATGMILALLFYQYLALFLVSQPSEQLFGVRGGSDFVHDIKWGAFVLFVAGLAVGHAAFISEYRYNRRTV